MQACFIPLGAPNVRIHPNKMAKAKQEEKFCRFNAQLIHAMKLYAFVLLLLVTTLFSCSRWEDVGPYDETTAEYGLMNFDRLRMGNAFKVRVVPGNTYRIVARGHRSDVQDLSVKKVNDNLEISYNHWTRNRKHPMEIEITMPALEKVEFSGAVNARVWGFEDAEDLEVELSGASELAFTGHTERLQADLSGASRLDLEGTTEQLDIECSGASKLRAYQYPSKQAKLDLSGASDAQISVVEQLICKASGASSLRYRGNPRTNLDLSGGSTVSQDN